MRERISIHAPHEGERPDGADNITDLAHISIHAPHEGERLLRLRGVAVKGAFQSTLPTRGSDLYPAVISKDFFTFQSTLPTRGSDKSQSELFDEVITFQSTLPTRGSDVTGTSCTV